MSGVNEPIWVLGGKFSYPQDLQQRFRGRWDSPHLVEATKQHQWRGHFLSQEGYRGNISGK